MKLVGVAGAISIQSTMLTQCGRRWGLVLAALTASGMVAEGLALVSEYSASAGKIVGPVRTVGCVGCGGEESSALLLPALGDLGGSGGVASSPPASEGGASVVVIDARSGDLDDASGVRAGKG